MSNKKPVRRYAVLVDAECEQMLQEAHKGLEKKGYPFMKQQMVQAALGYYGMSKLLKQFVEFAKIAPDKTKKQEQQ